MKKKRIYQLIGVLGFIIILIRVDISSIVAALRNVDLNAFLCAVLIAFMIPVFKAIRWNALLKIYDVNVGFKNVLIIYLMGTFLGVITPSKIGDLSRAFYIKKIYKLNVSSGKLFANVITDRILDLCVVAIVAIVGSAFYLNKYLFLFLVLCVAAAGLIAFLYIFRHKVIAPVASLLESIEKLFPKLSLRIHFDEVIEGLRVLRTSRIVYPLIFNIISYGVFYVLIIFLSRSLNMQISPFYLIVGLSSAMLLSVLPITIAGIGIRDITLIFFYSKVGISNEVTLSFSLLYLFICLLAPGVLGVIPYLLQPESLRKGLMEARDRGEF